MLSCIICSRYSDISPELKQNIHNTIGVDYELVVIDNSRNEYSIFSAYNEGVRRAKGDIFCFMHEDIEYVTPNWGSIVQREMLNSKVGCIGVAGTYFMPQKLATWCSVYANIGQWIYKTPDGNLVTYDMGKGISEDNSVLAVVVDGLWMCIRASLFDQIRFDENTYHGGFHCYDLDICMQVHSVGYEVRVSTEIMMIHSSMGNVNSDFYERLEKWNAKWRWMLPMLAVRRGGAVQERELVLQTISDIITEKDKRYYDLYTSKAYRLGRFLLKPIRVLKRLRAKIHGKRI